jgi:hypothetical protein
MVDTINKLLKKRGDFYEKKHVKMYRSFSITCLAVGALTRTRGGG